MDDIRLDACDAEDLPRHLDRLPHLRVMDVDYVHLRLENGDDLYVTDYGRPFIGHLLPDNYWTDSAWFRDHAERLSGTSTLFRIRTKPVRGRDKDIVLKWNRMGQDVPGETQARELESAEFNSPFEEFSLVCEMRLARAQSPPRVLTHKPLAIYVPAGHVELDSLGRRQYKFETKIDSHKEIALDMHRNYAVIYEWVKGMDAAQAVRQGLLKREELSALLTRSDEEMEQKGFVVRDNKAAHLIVRTTPEGWLDRDRRGEILYASVDFELLERTPQYESAIRAEKRKAYLIRQARRFQATVQCPPNLAMVNLMGVDYVYGPIESTGGAMWVVGKDPALFEYFLPEKWRRTPRVKLSVVNQIYDTRTKDNIHLVWKVSRVGEQPDMDPFKNDEKRILEYGYNSPFEEMSLNLELSRRNIPTTYPRAIYMTGHRSEMTAMLSDDNRYRTHHSLRTPDGLPILRQNHDYIIIWGYWNGPDELLAANDQEYFRSISAIQAYREALVDEADYLRIMEKTRQRLHEVGVEDLNLRGNHFLLAIDRGGKLDRDADGTPSVRICNFELLRKIS